MLTSFLASGSKELLLRFFQVLIEHDGPITTIAVPTSSNIVLSGSKDKHAIIWNFKDGTVVHKLPAHQDEIVKVAVTYDSIVAISGKNFDLEPWKLE